MASCTPDTQGHSAQQLQKEVRKLRKKLRQIENLDRLDRELNEEELDKISKMHEIREELAEKLNLIESEPSAANSSNVSMATSISEGDSPTSSFSSPWQKTPGDSFLETSEEVISDGSRLQTEDESLVSEPRSTFNTSDSPQQLRSEEDELNQAHSHKTSTPKVEEPSPKGYKKRSRSKRKVQEKEKESSLEMGWLDRSLIVTTLEGHFDVVCSLDTNGSILLTGSRDTTVRVWSLHSLEELHSMGGHSAAVTCVKILPDGEEIQGLDDSLDATRSLSPPTQLGISGSLDCHISIWDLERGQKVGHIYTFSPITCLEYFNKKAIVGTDGGKLEIWDLDTKQSHSVIRGPSKGITCLYREGCKLHCGDTAGTIEVWRIATEDQPDKLVKPEKPDALWNASQVAREEEEEEGDALFSARCVRCVAAYGQCTYWGDDGTNVKVLNCATGNVHKLTNHTQRFGSTGGLAVAPSGGLLFAAGYNLDTGNATINVRSLPEEAYVCSISTEDHPTRYISSVAVTKQPSPADKRVDLRLCTGGNELRVWDVVPSEKLPSKKQFLPNQTLARCSLEEGYNTTYCTDTESEGEDSDTEEQSPAYLHTHPLPQAKPQGDIEAAARRESWIWWLCRCTIL